MENKEVQAQILATLSALKTSARPDITNEELLAFIDKTLAPEEHQKVLSRLAHDPMLLSMAVKTTQVKAQFAQLPDKSEKSESWYNKLVDNFKKHWFSSSAAGGLVTASLAYVLLMPAVNLDNTQQLLNSSFQLADIERQSIAAKSKELFPPKSQILNPDTIDFLAGVEQAKYKLSLTEQNLELRDCSDEQDCQRQNLLRITGNWVELTRLQCTSENSVKMSFWQQQAEIYQQLLEANKEHQLPLPSLNNKNEAALCAIAQRINTKLE